MKTIKDITICILLLFVAVNNGSGQDNALADSYFQQAAEYKKEMKPDSAIIYFEKAAVEFQKNRAIEKYIDSYNQVGIILTRQDKYEKALNYLNKALSEGLVSLDSNNLTITTTYISLGVVYNALENYGQSLIYHHKALDIRLLKLGEYHADIATSYGNIGNVFRNNKELDKSIEAHLKAMQIRKKIFGITSAEIIDSYIGLGNAYREKTAYGTSLEYFEKALKNKILQRGERHKDLVRFYRYISQIHSLMGNKIKAAEYKAKWEEIEKI